MSSGGIIALARHMAVTFDDLGIAYVLGGSVASTMLGEPRSTVDVDIALSLPDDASDALLERLAVDFYVPMSVARAAIAAKDSFNVLATDTGLKVDLFVLGDEPLDRLQIERRVRVVNDAFPDGIWVTSPEDQVLRKLWWYRLGGEVSDRQWRDVVGLLATQERLDIDVIRVTAQELALDDLLDEAVAQARPK